MTTYRFHLRPSQGEEEKPGTLFIRVIHRRRYKDIRRDYEVWPREWNAAEQKVILPPEDASRRDRLLDIEQAIHEDMERMTGIVQRLSAEGEFSVRDVCTQFQATHQSDTLLTFARKLEQELLANGQSRTARAYRSAAKSLIRYNGRKDILLCDLQASLIRTYEQHLLNQGLQMNTVSFYMRNLRAIYYKAVKAGRIASQQVNPFEQVFTGVYQTKRRALDQKDMSALARLDEALARELSRSVKRKRDKKQAEKEPSPETRALRHALMYFLFAYHCRGMSFIDLAYLKKTEVGKETVLYKRKKTGFYMEVKITGPMRKIMNFFKRETEDSPYVFPIISGCDANHRSQYETGLTRQNKMLKLLASMAGINKNLSTHVARHTWATLAKRMGFSVSLISEGLGHRDPKITSIYLASFERSAMDELSIRLSEAVTAA